MVSSTRMQYTKRKAQSSWEVDESPVLKKKSVCPTVDALRQAAGKKKAKDT